MRTLLIDDHGIMRAGVKTLILHGYQGAEVLEASNVEAALALARAAGPDLIFLDLKLPMAEGAEESVDSGLFALEQLCELDSPAPVVVMSGEKGRELVDLVLKKGAASFVPKTAAQEVMFEAIRRALHGGVYLPADAIGRGGDEPPPSMNVLLKEQPKPVTNHDLKITPREFDVLRLALQGNAPWKIALILAINAANVRRYLSRLYEKFGVLDLYGLQSHFAKTGQVLGIITANDKAELSQQAKAVAG